VSPCDRIAADAAGLATLPSGDPDATAARAHAANCPDCARALLEGARLHALLGEAPQPAPPSPAALSRARARVLADLRPPRSGAIAVAAAVATGWPLVVLLERALGRSNESLGSPHGAESLTLVALAVVAPLVFRRAGLLLVAVLVVIAAAFAIVTADATATTGIFGCLGIEVLAGVVPLATTLFLVRRGQAAGGAARFGAVAAAGALAAQAGAHLTCPNHAMPHLLAFHFGGVVAAALVGAASARLLRVRPA
jgi:hypothetical protein